MAFGSVAGNPAHLVRLGDDSQRANRSQTKDLRGSSHRQIVGQQYRHRKLRAQQEALPLSCLEFFQLMVRREPRYLFDLKSVPIGEGELFADCCGPLRLAPHTLGNVELVENRQEGEATDFREVDQGTGIGDSG